ncbi:MAG: FAD-dependent oxidoreductase [Verrucomicrobiales bacterium]|nr:FAD-dependent oxidoreductase [Verrucomicrobiales bacterium]
MTLNKALLSCLAAATAIVGGSVTAADPILIEAEAFENHGGWKLDTQFIEIMGSPYLMAHGLGKPVEDAVTTVKVAEAGKYRVWARTKDWVAHWEAPGTPGRFQIAIGDKTLETEFGTEGAEWHWQDGGEIELAAGETEIRLKDLTGFNGRCDAIVLSQGDAAPDNTSEILPAWRRTALGLPEKPELAGEYDMVFIGGGYAGMCGAVSAARMGIKTALIQNREVLGGNGSSEIRVWAKGNTPGGLYPVGDIIRELEDHAKASPGTYEEYGDAHKDAIVRAEENLSLFLGHHAFDVVMDGNKIKSVLALETSSGMIREFKAPYFCDSTGHGYIGIKAGADNTMIDGGRMGMSNMWTWHDEGEETSFPETPWALELDEKGFPYPRKGHAEWFWESGYDKHPLDDLELIRDWNLRANFGAWNAIKNGDAYGRYDLTGANHKNASLEWMAYIGGTRETLQLLGDVVLTADDITSGREFDDAAVLTTWSIDLHYPKEQYIGKYEDNPFISYAHHDRAVDRTVGYPVPYRCFYSRNIENLFMAGRNVSVTHEALGTVRVMKTGGMMGVVVGKAAAVAAEHNTTPRNVYESYLPELIELMKLPGNMRRATLEDEFEKDPELPEFQELTKADMTGGIGLNRVDGIVIDDDKAKLTGNWTGGSGLKGFIGTQYQYGRTGDARFNFEIPSDGEWDVRMSWQPHENRSSKTKVQVVLDGEVVEETVVNQRKAGELKFGFHSLLKEDLEKGQKGSVVVLTEGADGNVAIDAVQLLKSE